MKDIASTSQELFKLYEKGPQAEAEEPIVDLKTGKPIESIYAASQWQLMWRKFLRNKAALGGGLVVLLFYLSALFANFLAPYTLTTRFRNNIYMPPQTVHWFDGGRFQPFVYDAKLTFNKADLSRTYTPDPDKKLPIRFFVRGEPHKLFGLIPTDAHLFGAEGGAEGGPICLLGTDMQGRDVLSRILLGSQVSLTIGLVGVVLSLALGSIMGLVSGYYGGRVDDLVQRIIELIRSFPAIPLWMALSAAIPHEWGDLQTYFAITVILSLIGWTWLARQLRGQVLALRSADFVLAARMAGASDRWVIFRHLVPATLGQIIVVSTLAMPSMVLAETSLSFLGLGLRPPITSWGVLINESQNYQTLAYYPWLFIPALVLAICIFAFSYLGDGLRDAVDPYTI